MKVIVTCKCNNTPEYAKDAFAIHFPNEEIPEVYSGKDKIHQLKDKMPYDSEVYRYLNAMAINRDKFAYLIEYEGKDVIDILDLLEGRRLA